MEKMTQNGDLAQKGLGQGKTLAINEIFYSVQGESSQAGRPTVFVRLMGCPLRCQYCDTEYAFYEGKKETFESLVDRIKAFGCQLVEVTGGEPLAQPNSVPFMQKLIDEGFEVMLETSGAYDIQNVPTEVKVVMDVKTPGSAELKRMNWDNIGFLKPGVDEVKFVVCSREDFDFAVEVAENYRLFQKYEVLVSPSFGQVSNRDLADWVLASKKPFRMQLQMHKYIWEPETRGV